MDFGLTERQLDSIRRVLADEPEVESAVIFGSRALGNYSPASDVDIALIGKNISVRDHLRINSLLTEVDAMLEFDIVRYSALVNKALVAHIDLHGRQIYKKASSTTEVA